MDHGFDPHDNEVAHHFDQWAQRLAALDGALGRELEHVPASVAVNAALKLAARIAASRPDLFSRWTVEGLLRVALDEHYPEGPGVII